MNCNDDSFLPESSNKIDIKKENKLVLNKYQVFLLGLAGKKFDSNFYLEKEKLLNVLNFSQMFKRIKSLLQIIYKLEI